MTDTKTSTSLGKSFEESRQERRSRRHSRNQETQQQTDVNIQDNKFFQILSNPELSNLEKQELISKALTYDTDLSNDENQGSLSMMSQYDEFLQTIRTQLASEQTELTRSNVYNDLQVTLDQLDAEYKGFESLLMPLANALEAIQGLRDQGRAVDAYNEARELKETEEQQKQGIADKNARYAELEDQIRTLMSSIEETKESGFLPLWMRSGDKAAIARYEGEIESTQEIITQVKAEIEAAQNEHNALLNQLASDPNKQAIRSLIDISSDAYREKQSKLVDHAHAFIEFSKTNLKTILGRLEHTGEQIDALMNNNTNLLEMYSIMVAGMRQAEGTNTETLQGVEQELEGMTEGGVDYLKTERQKINVERFMGDLEHLVRGSLQTQGQVQGQAAFLVNLERHNANSIARTKSLRAEGIATVADRIAIVLTTINNAASREQAEIVGDTFRRARETSADILRNQFKDAAHDVRDENNRILDLIDQLGDLHSDVVGTTGELKDGLREAKELYAEAEQVIKDVKDAVGNFEKVDADILREGPAQAGERAASTDAQKDNSAANLGFKMKP